MPTQELALSLPGEEAEVLAFRPPGDLQARLGGDLAHPGLGQIPEWKAQPPERAGLQPREHVGLVLRRVAGTREEGPRAVIRDLGVVTGGELGGAEAIGEGDHRVDAQLPVAEDAGIGSASLGVAAQERPDDPVPELSLEVERQMRDPERMREPSRSQNGLGRAAAALAIGVLVRPELQRHRDDLAARLALSQGGDGRVHPATERNQNPLTTAGWRLRKR